MMARDKMIRCLTIAPVAPALCVRNFFFMRENWKFANLGKIMREAGANRGQRLRHGLIHYSPPEEKRWRLATSCALTSENHTKMSTDVFRCSSLSLQKISNPIDRLPVIMRARSDCFPIYSSESVRSGPV